MHSDWPQLRQDLSLYEAPPDPSGAPQWTLHDPIRNKYYTIDWLAFEVIARLHWQDAALIAEKISRETTLMVDAAGVGLVLEFLMQHQLVTQGHERAYLELHQKAKSQESSWYAQLFHQYLFLRVPLLRPDRFLSRLVKVTGIFYSPAFWVLTALAGLLGLLGALTRWDLFRSTLVNTFSWDGFLSYLLALMGVKFFHELGHAITAKRYGCTVPTMGVAFMALWPMAYTDVTATWKLRSHRERLVVSAAGILTEIMVAAWCLLLWAYLPDGLLKGVCFFLGTTSVVASLAINASPFMRFDGYFLLCDYLGKANLHARSFAYARWWLREKLFTWNDEPPEYLGSNEARWTLVFAWATWLYRFILFWGIALMVYHFFFKLLGLFLFVLEIFYFIIRPIWSEWRVWQERWSEIGPVFSQKPAARYALILGLILFLPIDLTVQSQAVLKPEQTYGVITFQPSRLIHLPPTVNTTIAEGEVLLEFDREELLLRRYKTQVKVNTLEKQFSGAAFASQTAPLQAIYKEQLESAEKELLAVDAELQRYLIKAPFTGVVMAAQPDLAVGMTIPKNQKILTFANPDSWVVDFYVNENDLRRIRRGAWGYFVSETPGQQHFWGEIVDIDQDVTRQLSDPILASHVAGGELPAQLQEQQSMLQQALYRVRMKVDRSWMPHEIGYLRGRVVVLGWPKSIAGDVIRGTVSNLLREVGF